MCGILGAFYYSPQGANDLNNFNEALQSLSHRGPDYQSMLHRQNSVLGHTRLSIIDTSSSAHQPFISHDERYALIYNGEIFNYKSVRAELEKKGVAFATQSDTEVLFQQLIHYGIEGLQQLNGFFAFVFVDYHRQTILVARDRIGIKPLLCYADEHKVIFSSEMHPLFHLGIDKNLDRTSIFTYLQLNYIPHQASVLKQCKKLPPGHYITGSLSSYQYEEPQPYYKIPFAEDNMLSVNPQNFAKAKTQLVDALTQAVQQRLVADVPLGTFLSGGIDSSIITTLAARHHSNINSFSIGFPEFPFFDETEYALAVAKKAGSNHHVFNITLAQFEERMFEILDAIDEPFADASAIAVHMLCAETAKHVKVALSGDGADELFAGYHKHKGEFLSRQTGVANLLLKRTAPLLGLLPSGRQNQALNTIRQAKKYADGLRLTRKERYWQLASILSLEEANYLLREKIVLQDTRLTDHAQQFIKRRDVFTRLLSKNGPFNEFLLADCHLILPNDMLKKVDLMSMRHGLEVRTPFLDHNVVELAFKIPSAFKITAEMKKKVLQDAFKDHLPEILYNRPKKGFEVPLLHFLRHTLRSAIEEKYLKPDFIVQQKIFNPEAVLAVKQRVFSKNPGDAANTLWALVVFQHWFIKHYSKF